MPRLFRRPSSKGVPTSTAEEDDDPHSVFSSLLNPVATATTHAPVRDREPGKLSHRRTRSSPGLLLSAAQDQLHSRPWLSLVVAERQGSWTGDRPPARKLVKDPGSAGSARPSFSHELSDHADESCGKEDAKDAGGAGMMRRGLERIRELYRREKG